MRTWSVEERRKDRSNKQKIQSVRRGRNKCNFLKATMLDKKHSVSPEICEIAANGEGEESDEGESGCEEEEENKESDNEDIKEGQDSTGLSKPCMPSIAEVDIHNRTHIPFRNWC